MSPGENTHWLPTHLRETLSLSLPVMLGRSGIVVMMTLDVVMTGHAGVAQLAALGLAMAPVQIMFVLGHGLLNGITVLTSQAVGMGKSDRAGTVWRVGTGYGLVLGLLWVVLSLWGGEFLLATGQSAQLASHGGRVMLQMAWGLPPMLIYFAAFMFLDGLSRPRPNVVVMVLANLLNLLLNWVFIFPHENGVLAGWDGMEGIGGMGAEGAALATSASRWFMAIALVGYVWWLGRPRRLESAGDPLGIRGALHYPLDIGHKLWRIGLPIGLSMGLESSAFAVLVLMVGWLGNQPMAVYQIAQNLYTLAYMLALGMGTAGGVRVGNAVGRGDHTGLVRAGWVAVGLGGVFFMGVWLAYTVFPGELAALYTDSAGVAALAIPAIMITAWFCVADCTQGALQGVLRGAADVWIPMWVVIIGFWGVSVPLGYALAFPWQMGVIGIMWGLFAGALVACLALVWRFHWVTQRQIAPV